MVNETVQGLLVAFVVTSLCAAAGAVEVPKPSYDKTKFSQEPTACDVLAAHPDDPNRVEGQRLDVNT